MPAPQEPDATAIVTVRNDTSASVVIHSKLRGNADFSEELRLESKQESTLVKYEEERCKVEPATDVVKGIRFETPAGCTGTLDPSMLEKWSIRDSQSRKWVVHLTADAIAASGCPS